MKKFINWGNLFGLLALTGLGWLIYDDIHSKNSSLIQNSKYEKQIADTTKYFYVKIQNIKDSFEHEETTMKQNIITLQKTFDQNKTRSIIKPTVNQEQKNNGNGNTNIQNSGIIANSVGVTVNTDRRLSLESADLLIRGLKTNQCQITVGTTGMGGENDHLANQLLSAADQAGCKTSGVMHGIGLGEFLGLRILYSPINTPVKSISVIENALGKSNISYSTLADPSQPNGAIYLYVGTKP